MAGDWIKMRSDLFTHPKIIRMSSALQADKLRVIGGLHAAWCLFDAHTDDGRLDGYTPEVLDNYLGWPGFSDAMIAIDWLEFDGESLAAPEFDSHNGQSAKRRAQEADRKREARKASASGADKKRTREEKRREDIKHSPSQPCADARFAMRATWQPSAHLPDLAKQAGVEIKPEKLGEFIAYWLTQPLTQRTQAEWDKALLQSARHDKLHSESSPPGKPPLKPDNFEQRDYGREVIAL